MQNHLALGGFVGLLQSSFLEVPGGLQHGNMMLRTVGSLAERRKVKTWL